MGTLDSYRGSDILVEAFKKLHNNKNYELFNLGGGSEESKIKELAKGYENIHVSGLIEHTKGMAICKSADILVMPFRKTPVLYKTLPMKTFEFIACGVPIVVTDTGEHADVIKHFGCGITCEPNSESMSRALNSLLTNKKLYKKLQDNCNKHKKDVDYSKTRRAFVEEFEGS